MELNNKIEKTLYKLPPRMATWIFNRIKHLPSVKKNIKKEYDSIMQDLEQVVKPYKGKVTTYSKLPKSGRDRAEILKEMKELNELETSRWKDGFVSGAVYHGDTEHIEFLNKIYALNSQSNPLHSDLWPSNVKYESEIVSMTANMLSAELANKDVQPEEQICGAVSSGGTESILLAMKAYRDHARVKKGIRKPEMIAPTTAHAAFEKASQYFNIKIIRTPIDKDCKADVTAVRKAINSNTIVIIGSAPAFPHGVIDPIEKLSELARANRIGFHTDACLGGFVLPWAEKLGYPVPPFDFRLPGVTSMSADTHKHGYAAKGTSVVLYRGFELRHYQYFKTTDWPGGMYLSPTFAGSRPGALSAACWAALVSIGEQGYTESVKKILQTATKIKEGVQSIPELKILGDSLWIITFTSETLDINQVIDVMSKKGWNLNGLHKPTCVHLCVTLRHTQPNIAKRFVSDLKEAVAHVKAHPDEKGGMAPVYGMAATMPVRSVIGDMLEQYMDLLYKV